MGGRIASLVADEAEVAGLVCLGYPFHPTGKPEQLRTEHLKSIQHSDTDRAGRARSVRQSGRGFRIQALKTHPNPLAAGW